MSDGIREVRFSEPPPVREMKYDWTAIAQRLKRKPGEWALVYSDDKQTYAVAIRSGKIAALRKSDGFESRTAGNDNINRTCALWVRFNPEADTRTR